MEVGGYLVVGNVFSQKFVFAAVEGVGVETGGDGGTDALAGVFFRGEVLRNGSFGTEVSAGFEDCAVGDGADCGGGFY